MFILDRRKLLQLTAAGAGAGALGLTANPAWAALQGADVFTADAFGGDVDSVIVMGEERAVLIDAQLNAANAERLADMIAATGRMLESIFITHAHPDHFLGLGTILGRFPDAQVWAHPAIQPQIAAAAGPMLEAMRGSPMGPFPDQAVIPEPLNADHILLEGERLEVLDPMHGDTELIAPVHIPALDVLVAADILFADTHVWVAENQTGAQLDQWRASLDQIEAMGVGTLIPGHRAENSANDASTIAYTRAYLDIWQAARESAGSAEELRAMMMEGRETLGLGFAVDRAVAAAFP